MLMLIIIIVVSLYIGENNIVVDVFLIHISRWIPLIPRK